MTLQEMGLTKPCLKCNGTKLVKVPDHILGKDHTVFCDSCETFGEVFTEEGIKLLRMIQRYWHKEL